jgi:hypothetical protein
MDKGPKDHFHGLHYQSRRATGPISFLSPTTRYIPVPGSDAKTRENQRSGAPSGSLSPAPSGAAGGDAGGPTADGPAKTAVTYDRQRGVYHVWRSRDNRKGRHSAIVTREFAAKGGAAVPQATNTWKATWRNILKMFVRYPIWDVSYDVAVVFTLGASETNLPYTSECVRI